MSERDGLLTTGTRDGADISPYKRVVMLVESSENVIKKLWAKTVRVIHAREFFAEFLATFVLMVSLLSLHQVMHSRFFTSCHDEVICKV